MSEDISAAPVSGPTCKACNGAGTWIGQHDGYDDADCAVCDGSGKAAPVSGQGANGLPPLEQDIYMVEQSMLECEPEDQRAWARVKAELPDSHPRSEDSRAKVLTDDEMHSIYQAGYDKFAGPKQFRHASNYHDYHTAGLRALASTTPQKADNE